MRKRHVIALLLVMMSFSARRPGFAAWQGGPSLPVFGYTVVHTYPHDHDAFTQGLQFIDGVFYEGTGLNGKSSIRKVKIETGEVLQKRDVPAQYFGEGITVRGSELFQLTWQTGVGFVYDRQTFAPKRQFKYAGEGWGLTQDKSSLIMSDGSEFLRFLDPATLAEKSRVRVTAAGSAAEEPERTRIRERRGVRQRLADRLRGAHRSRRRQGERLHRSARPAHGAGAGRRPTS